MTTFFTKTSGRVLAAACGIALTGGGAGALLVPSSGPEGALRIAGYVLIFCVTVAIFACVVAAYESPGEAVGWVIGLPGALFAYYYALGEAYAHAPWTAYALVPIGLGAIAMAAFKKGVEAPAAQEGATAAAPRLS